MKDPNIERAILKEKGNLIKDALKIVNELAKSDLADIDGNDFDVGQLQELIVRARNLRKNRWWDL